MTDEEKFRNKYRISSTRLKNWDYGSDGGYFITVCTQDRNHYFGSIENGIMKPYPMGRIAAEHWMEIPNHFPFVELDVFVMMPNHIHGILIINKTKRINVPGFSVETHDHASLQQTHIHPSYGVNSKSNMFGPQSANLASVVRGYKASVKKYSNQNRIDFAWQPRYYDHIVRNDKDLNRIREYITYNPTRWEQDDHFC